MIVERIIEYLQAKGIAVSAFEKELGLGNTTLSRAFRSGGSIGTDKLEKILSHCTDLSPLWLLTGDGDMLKNGDAPKAQAKEKAVHVRVTNFGELKDLIVEAIIEAEKVKNQEVK